MSRIFLAFAMVFAGAICQAPAAERDATANLLNPWNLDWRNTAGWQAGVAKTRPSFAPPGCYVTRLVTVGQEQRLQREYICR